MEPVLISAIAGGVLGIGGNLFGSNPREEQTESALANLKSMEDWLKDTPFSKEEIMNQLLPEVQKMYRTAADVVAGKAGAMAGESGMAGGQPSMEYYLQTLSPIIGQGEMQAAGAVSEFGKWYSTLDSEAKQRFLQSIQLELQSAGNLPEQDTLQQTLTGALQGINLGVSAGGNIASANAANAQTDYIKSLIGNNTTSPNNFNILDYSAGGMGVNSLDPTRKDPTIQGLGKIR